MGRHREDPSRPIPARQACRRCAIKYRQEHGLCYTCRDIVFGPRERKPPTHVEPERAPTPEPATRRTVTVRGIDYEVVWDGTMKHVVLADGHLSR